MCATGWAWNIYSCNFHPEELPWRFWPWNTSGIELFNMDFLDYCFYPVCGFTFLMFFQYLNNIITVKPQTRYKYYLIIFYAILGITVLLTAPKGGCAYSLVIAGIFPGIIALFFVYSIKPSVYWLGGVLMLVFASSWDIGVVSIIPEITGFEGTEQWRYLMHKKIGEVIQIVKPSFFIQGEWAWLEGNPLETSFFLAIASHPWLYPIWSIFYDKNHIFNKDLQNRIK
jgi:hypothetical protein